MRRLSKLSQMLVSAFISAITGPAIAQSETLSQEQFKKITALYQDARSQYMQKQYVKSNEIYQQVLSLLPPTSEGTLDRNRAGVHYNIGCNYALLGKKKDAIDSLGRAVSHGFWDHAYLTKDPSLKDIAADKDFKALADKCKRAIAELPLAYTDILSGKKLEKKDYEGKVLILDVWGTWCPPCRAEIPSFVRLQEKYRDKGLRIIGLTYERGAADDNSAKKRVQSFASDNKVNYALVLATPALVTTLGVESFPTTFFIGRDGTVSERIMGLHDYEDLEEKVLGLLKAK